MSWFRIRTIAFYGFMATVVAIIMATGLLDAIVFTLFRPRVSSREQVDNILLVVKLVGVVIIFAPLFLVMQLFLRGEIAFGASGDASLSRWETNRKHDDLKLEVESLKRTMEEYRKKSESPERVMPATDDEARAAILKLAPELTLEMLKKEVTTKIVNLSISEYAERTWREMEGNLRAAVASSRRHQVTNLMIGGFGSLIAVLFLFVLIYDAGDRIARTQDWIGLLRHYAPWFSMIVIIEVVVFLFFKPLPAKY